MKIAWIYVIGYYSRGNGLLWYATNDAQLYSQEKRRLRGIGCRIVCEQKERI